MSITIIRRELPPWLKRKSQRPAVWTLPDDYENGDRLPRRWSEEHPPPPMRGGSTALAYSVNSAIFAAPAAVHTILDVISPAGHGLALTEVSLSFDGVTASAVPCYVEVVTSTQATAGTGGTAPTITQSRGRTTTGQAPTASGSHTAEPTALVRVRSWYVTPNGGLFVYPLPLGREIECDSSGGTLKGLATRITPTATVNAQCYMEVEAVG
jgi:hypothetical protein